MSLLSAYHVEQCNALGRALPKLRKRAMDYRGSVDGPIWSELYHVEEVVGMHWRQLRREIAEECAPWFDGSAFSSAASEGHGSKT